VSEKNRGRWSSFLVIYAHFQVGVYTPQSNPLYPLPPLPLSKLRRKMKKSSISKHEKNPGKNPGIVRDVDP
jgi:hypothetical protein